jgi:hypothetical protein
MNLKKIGCACLCVLTDLWLLRFFAFHLKYRRTRFFFYFRPLAIKSIYTAIDSELLFIRP